MSPRIQGGRPGPSDITFTVTFPSSMSCADIASVGDVLGPYVWFDDATGGIICWADPQALEFAYGDMADWWDALSDALTSLGAVPDEEYGGGA